MNVCLVTGAAPDIQVCSRTQFSRIGDVVPVGCTVCIPEGDIIRLDCTAQSSTKVFYEWKNSADLVVSTSPLLITRTNDNYTCTATNLDHTPTIAVSMVVCE